MIAADMQQKNLTALKNMVMARTAADYYAGEHQGKFPPTVDELKYYYPFGDPVSKKPGMPPVNPFTDKPEWPTEGHITSVKEASSKAMDLKPGEVQYNSLDLERSYAIVGGNEKGKAFSGPELLNMMVKNMKMPPISIDQNLATTVLSNH
jgi:hypothetical protein